QFVELLLQHGDKETTISILRNYMGCLDAKDVEPRRKTSIGLSQLADLFALAGPEVIASAVAKLGACLAKESDSELRSLLSAAFVRLSAEASNRKQYVALSEVCAAMEEIGKQSPVLAGELRPRVGVEN